MAATTKLMTVEEFSNLPEDSGPVYHELRQGELVAVTRPRFDHHLIQDRLVEILKQISRPFGYATMELAFRALPEHDLRVADVAFVSKERKDRIDRKGYLHGAPDIVIEILSPLNTVAEMNERERLCLQNGCREFWVIDPDLRQVKISTPDGYTRTWLSGQEIPLPLFGDVKLGVDSIFEAINEPPMNADERG